MKYDEGYCHNCKKAVRDGVIKEIEKLKKYDAECDMDYIHYEDIIILSRKKEWERFKHNPFEKKSVIIGKTKGGKEK